MCTSDTFHKDVGFFPQSREVQQHTLPSFIHNEEQITGFRFPDHKKHLSQQQKDNLFTWNEKMGYE